MYQMNLQKQKNLQIHQKHQRSLQKHQKSLQIKQIINKILNRKVDLQFIREHRTALLSMVLLTLSGAFLYGAAPITIGILACLSIAGTIGFQLLRNIIANRSFQDLLDKDIITVKPSLKNKVYSIKCKLDNSGNSKNYLNKGYNAEQSWKGYLTCPWTLPGSENNRLVQAGRKTSEVISKIQTKMACKSTLK